MFAYVPEIPGIVTEVSDIRPKPFTNWHECAPFVEANWVFDGETFTPPPIAEPDELTPQQLLQYAAQARLDKNDKVATRCTKAGVPYPSDWLAFDVALRAIANGTDTISTHLPATPSYPAGT